MTIGDSIAAERLSQALDHYDRAQLGFQIQEIVVESGYLRHGIVVNEDSVVLDVGANVGVAASFFASICGAAEVHCFEPIPRVYEVLERNTREYSSCHCHPYGLGRAEGEAAFTFYPQAAAMSGQYADAVVDRALVRVAMLNLGLGSDEADAALDGRYSGEELRAPIRTLSSVISELSLRRIDLLKIDVEKAEIDVLAGIGDSDWPSIEQLVIEVHDFDGRLDAVRAQLRGFGYVVETDQEVAFAGTEVHLLFARRPG